MTSASDFSAHMERWTFICHCGNLHVAQEAQMHALMRKSAAASMQAKTTRFTSKCGNTSQWLLREAKRSKNITSYICKRALTLIVRIWHEKWSCYLRPTLYYCEAQTNTNSTIHLRQTCWKKTMGLIILTTPSRIKNCSTSRSALYSNRFYGSFRALVASKVTCCGGSVPASKTTSAFQAKANF